MTLLGGTEQASNWLGGQYYVVVCSGNQRKVNDASYVVECSHGRSARYDIPFGFPLFPVGSSVVINSIRIDMLQND